MKSLSTMNRLWVLLLLLSLVGVVSATQYSSTQWGKTSGSAPGVSQLILIVAVIIIIYLVYKLIKAYNVFYRLINDSEAQFNQIRVAMKKRLDLINQLRMATGSYSNFERGTLEEVTAMRTAVDDANPEKLNEIASRSTTLLGRLYAVVESYPDLKTSTLVTSLMTSINNVENEITNNRYAYNLITKQFNTLLDTIPTNIAGKIFRLKRMQYLAFEDEISVAPGININK